VHQVRQEFREQKQRKTKRIVSLREADALLSGLHDQTLKVLSCTASISCIGSLTPRLAGDMLSRQSKRTQEEKDKDRAKVEVSRNDA
jgi:hypothetical protein